MNTILDNDFTTLTLLFGVIFTITGSLYKLFPPNKMTWYYGVQTKSARRTEETWAGSNSVCCITSNSYWISDDYFSVFTVHF